MKRAEAQKSIDEAFADALKELFVLFTKNITAQGRMAKALAEFERGVERLDEAYTQACGVIERVFPE